MRILLLITLLASPAHASQVLTDVLTTIYENDLSLPDTDFDTLNYELITTPIPDFIEIDAEIIQELTHELVTTPDINLEPEMNDPDELTGLNEATTCVRRCTKTKDGVETCIEVCHTW